MLASPTTWPVMCNACVVTRKSCAPGARRCCKRGSERRVSVDSIHRAARKRWRKSVETRFPSQPSPCLERACPGRFGALELFRLAGVLAWPRDGPQPLFFALSVRSVASSNSSKLPAERAVFRMTARLSVLRTSCFEAPMATACSPSSSSTVPSQPLGPGLQSTLNRGIMRRAQASLEPDRNSRGRCCKRPRSASGGMLRR